MATVSLREPQHLSSKTSPKKGEPPPPKNSIPQSWLIEWVSPKGLPVLNALSFENQGRTSENSPKWVTKSVSKLLTTSGGVVAQSQIYLKQVRGLWGTSKALTVLSRVDGSFV